MFSSSAEGSAFKDYTSLILKILIAAGVIIYLISSLDSAGIYNSLKEADPVFLSASAMLLPFNLFLQYLRWKQCCSYFLRSDNRRKIWSSLFVGFSAALFTPGRAGEYVGRGVEFKEKRIIDIAAAVFFDKLYGLIWIIALGCLGGYYILTYLGRSFHIYSYLWILFLIVFVYFIFVLTKRRKWFRGIIWSIKPFRALLEKMSSVRKPGWDFSLKMLLISLIFYIIYVIQFVLLFAAFTLNPCILLLLSLSAIILLIKTIIPNLISGEFGIRESAAVFFFTLVGENPSAGFNASVVLFFINILIPSIAGIFLLLRKRDG